MRIGIDPGTTHIGIAQIDPSNNLARIWQINKHREENNWQRIINIQHLLKRLDMIFSASFDVIIEGASFGDRYRQVELAEIRASIALWFDQCGGRCHIIPPTKIRKQVFNNGKMKADQAWDGLPPDALAALSCAYYIT